MMGLRKKKADIYRYVIGAFKIGLNSGLGACECWAAGNDI